MITLHLLQLLSDEGFGTIDENLFFEKLPGKGSGNELATGISIYSRGFPVVRGNRLGQNFDLYSRGTDDLTGADVLEQILTFLLDSYGTTCTLPAVPGYSQTEYQNVILMPTSNVENVGQDETDRVIFRLAGQIKYKKLRS